MAAMMPSIAASPLMLSAFSFMILLELGLQFERLGETEIQVASNGVGKETEHKSDHRCPTICFLCSLGMRLEPVLLNVGLVDVHLRFTGKQVLTSAVFGGHGHLY